MEEREARAVAAQDSGEVSRLYLRPLHKRPLR